MDRSTDRLSDEARGAQELLLAVSPARGTLRQAIQEGRLAPRTPLPASRRLAADLGVSRGVVTDAYDQLACEGYLEVSPRQAPVVTQVAATRPPAAEPPAPAWRFDFTEATPEVAMFPRRSWARAVQRALAHAPDIALDYGDYRGRTELRAALSSYLARVRGVRADPGRIIITQGFTQALDMLCHVLAASGRSTMAMESPSHPGLWATVRQSGLTLTGCPVDEQGLTMTELSAEAVVVSPAHQFPTGVVLAPSRRHELVRWAAASRALVIEDDYDAEFRYDRTPVGAIQGLDPERVAHVGSASKSLAPGVRLGWITAPAWLVSDLAARKSATDSGSPALDQLALAHLLQAGEYERHVARARRAYRRRRDLLVQALREHRPGLRIHGAAAGMQLLLPLPDDADDAALAEAARAEGINIAPLSRFHLTDSPRRGLLAGFGRLPEYKIGPAADALASLLSR
jgi:GntR family transcriptional regulator / MocR family aminotransferase